MTFCSPSCDCEVDDFPAELAAGLDSTFSDPSFEEEVLVFVSLSDSECVDLTRAATISSLE